MNETQSNPNASPYMVMTGYEPITTFWQDFTIAEAFGMSAIIETFDRCFKEWHNEYKYLTEFVMVLNHKCNYHYELENFEVSDLYSDLFYKTQDYAYNNLKGEELEYCIRTLD